MKLPISPRLLACCAYIAPGSRVADVGCDHGYLAIHLLQNKIATSVIASDINEGPLRSAMENAEKYGLTENISFHLSDGVKNIPRDFNTLVCAGMGGDTMISILEAAPWLRSDRYRLVLQCQSKTPMLRQYLSDNGWDICRETVLRDGRFLYTVMEARYAPATPLTPGQCYITPALLSARDGALGDYWRWMMGGLELTLRHRSDPYLQTVLDELRQLPQTYPFLEE